MDDAETKELYENLKASNPLIVADTLAKIGDRREMRDLAQVIALIHHENAHIKKTAISAAVAIIRSSIIENYQQLTPDGRKKLAEIIDRIHPETVQELMHNIHSASEDLRIESLMILGLLRRRESIRALIEREIKNPSEKVRATAVQALGCSPSAGEHLVLLKQLNDQDSRVRANAVEALEQYNDPKLAFSLKRLLNDGNNRVRANALKALYHLGITKIENDVAGMLAERSPLMAASGLWLIAELSLDSPELKSLCAQYRNHPDPVVQRNFQRAAGHLHLDR